MAEGLSDAQQMSLRLARCLKETLKLPTTQDMNLKRLATNFLPMCKGPTMQALWENVMGKLSPESQTEAETEEELLAKIEEKKKILQELKKGTASQKQQLKKDQESLQFLNQEVNDLRHLEQLIQMKCLMYGNYCEYMSDFNSKCKASSQWISRLCHAYEGDITETAKSDFQRDIESACSILMENIDADDRSPERLFAVAGMLRKKFSPKIILPAIVKFTEISIEKLRENMKSYDVERDLFELGKIRTEVAQEFGIDSSTLESRLQQRDMECVKNYTESLECEQSCDRMMKEAMSFRDRIIDSFKQQYEFEPTALQLAIDHLDAQAEVDALQACVHSLQSACEKLLQENAEKAGAEGKLNKMKKKFEDLKVVMEKNNRIYKEMVEHKKEVVSSLKQRQRDSAEVGRHEISESHVKVTEACEDLASSLQEKRNLFDDADLNKMHQVEVLEDLKPVAELTVHRYNNISPEEGGFCYQKAIHNFGMHSHVPPSTLLQKILQVKSEVDRLAEMHNSVNLSEIEKLCDDLQNLCAKCIENDKTILEKLKPLNESGERTAEIAESQCQELEDTIKIWSEQPAQFQTPWLIRNGMTFEEWRAGKTTKK